MSGRSLLLRPVVGRGSLVTGATLPTVGEDWLGEGGGEVDGEGWLGEGGGEGWNRSRKKTRS